MDSYDNAIRAFPENINAYLGKAYVLTKQGKNKEEVKALLKRAATLNDIGLYDLFRKGVVLKVPTKYKGNMKCYSKNVVKDVSVVD